MKVLKGWKTLTFNILAIAVMQWDDVRQGILSLFGGWEYAVSVLAAMNIILRVITVGPVAMMWISKEEQDGIQALEKKP
jgi:hypothetical protein